MQNKYSSVVFTSQKLRRLILSKMLLHSYTESIKVVGLEYGPRPLGPKEIDELLVSPGRASTLRSGLCRPRRSYLSGYFSSTFCWS